MRILMIACSRKGAGWMQRVQSSWREVEWICRIKCAALPESNMPESVSQCVSEWFQQVDGILFFSAAGIAVRAIAPCLVHKSQDPGVAVMDESGQFCISLLSGHMGGGNELARRVAEICGATAVITTATDREGLFSVDVYARRHGLKVTDWEMSKRISAALLEGKQIGFQIDEDDRWLEESEYVEEFPPEVYFLGRTVSDEMQGSKGTGKQQGATGSCQMEMGVCVSGRRSVQPVFSQTLKLVPARFIVGIGCRKGCPEERIRRAVEECLEQLDLCGEAVAAIATIDLKKEEPGLKDFCRRFCLPLFTFSAEELSKLEGHFSESAFVGQVTGVTNVCERSAFAAAGAGARMVCTKQIRDGVTVAVAVSGSTAQACGE